MAGLIGQGVTLRGYHIEDWIFTFNLAAGITSSDVGKAVSLDTSGSNKVKLAADGDRIIGRLTTVENRTQEGLLVGAVELKFLNTLPIKAGEVVAVGNSVQGAGSGEVKALAASTDTDGTGAPAIKAASHNQTNIVVEVANGLATVIQF